MNLNEYRKTFLKPVNRNLKLKETLDTLEQDNEFQKRSERFLTSVGENSDDIFEYLRDSDYNLHIIYIVVLKEHLKVNFLLLNKKLTIDT